MQQKGMVVLRTIKWITGIALLVLFSLNASSQPPQIRLVQSTSKAIVDQPYEVYYEITWPGDAGDRSILPPSHIELDWADVTVASSVTSVRDGANVVQHNLVLYPREAGSFEFPPLILAYLDTADLLPSSESEEGASPIYPTISAEAFDITVVNPPDPLMYVIGGALVLGAGAAGTVLIRRRQVAAANAATVIPMPTLPDAMNAARQHRLDRKPYEFFQALIRGASLLSASPDHTQLKKQFETKAKEVGFQSYLPTEDELDGALRDLERAYNQDKGSQA